ncbi:MAG: DoxX family protein [Chthoniobacterales bacterium]
MQFLAKYSDFGLLLLRVSLGVLFIIVCAPVLMGGSSAWSRFGSGIHVLGLHSHYGMWGFVGSLLACAAAVLMIFGLFFRLGVLVCLVVALIHAFTAGHNVHALLIPIELVLVLLSVLFIGPGKYSVDKT